MLRLEPPDGARNRREARKVGESTRLQRIGLRVATHLVPFLANGKIASVQSRYDAANERLGVRCRAAHPSRLFDHIAWVFTAWVHTFEAR